MNSFALAILATSAMAVSLNAGPAKPKHTVTFKDGMAKWDDGQLITKSKDNSAILPWVQRDPLVAEYKMKCCDKEPFFICKLNGDKNPYPTKAMK
jgi:hypothetical protein